MIRCPLQGKKRGSIFMCKSSLYLVGFCCPFFSLLIFPSPLLFLSVSSRLVSFNHIHPLFLHQDLGLLSLMSTAIRRAQRVVTDSEDDFVDIRQRHRHDLQLTNRSQTPPIAEHDEEETKIKSKRKPTNIPPLNSYIHTAPIHILSKPSVLSKEAPPVEGGYHGFIRLGSEYTHHQHGKNRASLILSMNLGCV